MGESTQSENVRNVKAEAKWKKIETTLKIKEQNAYMCIIESFCCIAEISTL